MEVTKCLERKDKIKYAIIPRKSDIAKGDAIAIIKLDEEEIKHGNRRDNR